MHLYLVALWFKLSFRKVNSPGVFMTLLCMPMGLSNLAYSASIHTDTQSQAQQQYHYEGAAMGTTVSMQFFASDARAADSLFQSSMKELQRLEQLWSPYIESSELSRINRSAAIAPVVISPETSVVSKTAQHYSRLSQGAFEFI